MDKTEQTFTFSKEERLTHKKVITQLFEEGKFVKRYPFKLLYINNPEEKHQVGIGVPKRKIKLAARRNTIKRRIREAYRLNKGILYSNSNITPLAIMILYHGDYIPSYAEIEKNTVHLLQELIRKQNTAT